MRSSMQVNLHLPLIPVGSKDPRPENGIRFRRANAPLRLARIIGAEPVVARRPRQHVLAAVFFLAAVLIYFVAGVTCLALPPTPSRSFGGHSIGKHATCVRVNRFASHVTADVFVGTPPVAMTLLVRLDQLVEPTANETNMRIASVKIVESETIDCTGTLCTDVALLQHAGPASNQRRTVVAFEYTNAVSETSPSTATELGLDGQLSLEYDHSYFLTATHLCWELASASDTSNALHAQVVDNQLVTTGADLATGPPAFRDTPVGEAQLESACVNTTFDAVKLFPVGASIEQTFLGLKSEHTYGSSNGISDRRSVVEVGSECASSHGALERAHALYELDCLSVYLPCVREASVPFRRVAHTEMRIDVSKAGDAHIWAAHDDRLDDLPNLEDANDAFALSVVKLILMLLVAAIVWIRAAKRTSSTSRLFKHCVRAAHCHKNDEGKIHKESVAEDALVGLLAIIARGGIAIWRIDSLEHDEQTRVAVFQLVAAILSFMHWLIRYTRFVVSDDNCETPLTKLGGSTALCDAPSAVMMAMSAPPLLVTSTGRFDPTARLLTAMLVTTMSVQRCFFSSACCGLLLSVSVSTNDKKRFDGPYRASIVSSLVMWLFQTAALGVLLVDVFAVPIAFSTTRSLDGDVWAVGYAIFFGITASSLPQLMASAVELLQPDT